MREIPADHTVGDLIGKRCHQVRKKCWLKKRFIGHRNGHKDCKSRDGFQNLCRFLLTLRAVIERCSRHSGGVALVCFEQKGPRPCVMKKLVVRAALCQSDNWSPEEARKCGLQVIDGARRAGEMDKMVLTLKS